ncbi:MAG TPA: hypothetical protein VNU68_31035 [Verrucomicrobiae bacterium]|nr:hypothetical protein [Verrucomicrobiae bacterium]
MLLRISVILAILAGLAVIGVGQFVLRPQIEEIRDTRDKNKQGWDKTTTELNKTKKTLKETSEDLAKTKSTLEDTKGALAATTAKFENEQKRANGLQEDKNRLSASLKAAQDDLAAWTNSGVKVTEIPALLGENKDLKSKNEALQAEVKVFAKKLDVANKRIAELVGKDVDVQLPHTVRGKVLVVDPKWDFLVLDVGSNNQVVQKGILIVSRNGELIAKVRVMDVQEQRSIANIMPGWKIKDVMEGDLVMAY